MHSPWSSQPERPVNAADDGVDRSSQTTAAGVTATNADQVHDLGIDGSDSTVAIIDIAFDPEYTEIADQVVGTVGDSGQFKPGTSGLHGTACAEFLAAVAPGADIVLASLVGTEFGPLMDDIISQYDPDVVSMSLNYPPTRRLDGEDAISARIAQYTDNGGLFVASAGDLADGVHWDGPFRDSDDNGYMEFDDQGTEFLEVDNSNLASGQEVFVQWDTDWETDDQRYTVELYDADKNQVTSKKTPTPTETLEIPGTESTAYLKIQRSDATGHEHFDIFAWGSDLSLPVSTRRRSLTAPATGTDSKLLTVGAVDPDTGTLVASSSRGPTQDGRRGVDLLAPGDTYSGALDGELSGTDASGPHVAGVAALLSEFSAVSAAEVRQALVRSARDIADSDVESPPHPAVGFGHVDAKAALEWLVGLERTWTRQTDGRAQGVRPAVDDNRVYVGGLDDTLYAFDRADGILAWTRERDGSLSDSSPVVHDGTLFVGSGGGTLYALDADTGATVWSTAAGSAITSSPTVIDGTVCVGTNDGQVRAWNVSDGSWAWATKIGGPVYSALASSDGLVFVSSDDGRLHCLDAGTGEQMWTFETGTELGSSAPVVGNGTVYLAADSVYAFSVSETRSKQWEQSYGGTVGSSPAVDGDTLYVGSADGQLYALETASGDPRWQSSAGVAVTSNPTVAGDRVFAVSEDGTLSVFRTDDGTRLGSDQLPADSRSSPVVVDNELYVGDRSGSYVSQSVERSPGPFVETDGTAFVVDGSEFRYIGGNSNHLPIQRWGRQYVDRALDFVASQGLNVIRTWSFPPQWTGTEVHPEPGTFQDGWFDHFDYVVAAAKRRGVRLILPILMNHYGTEHAPSPKTYAAWSDTASGHNEFFADEQANQYFKNYIEYILTRENQYTGLEYRNDPTIMMWEVGNEVEYDDARRGDSLAFWYDDIAAYIKSIDDNHIVGTGMHGATGETYESWNRRNAYRESHQSPHIDACSFHEYPIYKYDGDVTERPKSKFADYIREHVRKAHDIGKPAYFGEFGVHVDLDTQYTLEKRQNYYQKAFDVGLLEGLYNINLWVPNLRNPNGDTRTYNEWPLTIFPDETQTWNVIQEYDQSL